MHNDGSISWSEAGRSAACYTLQSGPALTWGNYIYYGGPSELPVESTQRDGLQYCPIQHSFDAAAGR